MKVLTANEIEMVSGASAPGIDPANAQVIKDIAIDAGIGAMLTPGAPWLGGGLSAAGSVIHGAINHGPVNVPMPSLPLGPTWNGSSRPPKPLICMSKQGQYESYCNGL
ncbi:E492 group microcin [Serratia fonticola]|uniref:E492 group microcin n=1 Tax=Serratia fonticola TaxID=47917 RepID=UPI0015C62585|nr:hypothetical protein [Serratia fonticola]MEB7885391.1 hypothetical protein [Serratia fonticola]NYA41842.1 hypothetical protein [Serratia fonticola]